MSYLQQYTKIIKMPTLQTYLVQWYQNWRVHQPKERHVVNVPKSSTFRGILICAIFRPGICKNTFLWSVLDWRIISIKRFFSWVHACVIGAMHSQTLHTVELYFFFYVIFHKGRLGSATMTICWVYIQIPCTHGSKI